MHDGRRKKKVVEQLNALVRANAANAPAQPQPSVSQPIQSPQTVQPQTPPVRQYQPTGAQGGSLSDMLKRAQQSKVAQTGQYGGAAPTQAAPVTQERLASCWATFARQLPDTEALMRSYMEVEPKVEGNEIRVATQTQMQAQGLTTYAPLLNYLKQNLGNTMLTIRAEVDPAAAKNVRVVYTLEQKMEYFSEKNSAFQELIKKFNLEAEY